MLLTVSLVFTVPKEDKEFMHGVPESGYEPNYNHRQQFLTTTTTTTTTITPRPPPPPPPPPPRKYPAQVINIHWLRTQFDKKRRTAHETFSIRFQSNAPRNPDPFKRSSSSTFVVPPKKPGKMKKKSHIFFKKNVSKKIAATCCFFFPVELGPPKGTLASILSLKGGSPQAERLR